jgi:hypothetical protein
MHAMVQRMALVGASVTLLLAVGCGSPARRETRGLVACVDATPSYHYTSLARELTARFVERGAQPGDVVFGRWILGEDTWAPEAIITTVAVPPITASPFTDRRQAQESAAQRVRQDGAARLRRAQAPEAHGTNVWGCIAKGAELLDSVRAPRRDIVVMSDLDENTELETGAVDLTGIYVWVLLYEARRPNESLAALRERVLQAGAVGFQHFDVSVPPEHVLRALKEG